VRWAVASRVPSADKQAAVRVAVAVARQTQHLRQLRPFRVLAACDRARCGAACKCRPRATRSDAPARPCCGLAAFAGLGCRGATVVFLTFRGSVLVWCALFTIVTLTPHRSRALGICQGGAQGNEARVFAPAKCVLAS